MDVLCAVLSLGAMATRPNIYGQEHTMTNKHLMEERHRGSAEFKFFVIEWFIVQFGPLACAAAVVGGLGRASLSII